LKISIFDPFPFMSGLVPTGRDCMATGSVAKPNEEQPKRLRYSFLAMMWVSASAVPSGE
jgi:hypothetical protein